MLIHLGMIAAIVALAVYFSSTGSSASSEDSVVQLTPSGLRFKPDNTFKIVQFTDMHYGEDPTFDAKTDEVQRTILALEQPDFVMFSGDQVSGWLANNVTSWYADRWSQLIAPVQAAGIPYASILGNHDDEGDLDRRQIVQLDIDTGAPLSHTRQGPVNVTGASNFYIDVWDAAGTAVAARIWGLDSMNRGCLSLKTDGWGCVGADTVGWVNATLQKLPKVPSLAYIHIPVPEFRPLWDEAAVNGTKDEPVACPILNSGVVGVARAAGIQAVWSGHCHNNDYHGVVGPVGGVKLGFGRKTGYGSYGPSLGRGKGAVVQVLRLGESTANAEVWVREESGAKVVLPPAVVKGEVQEFCST